MRADLGQFGRMILVGIGLGVGWIRAALWLLRCMMCVGFGQGAGKF